MASKLQVTEKLRQLRPFWRLIGIRSKRLVLAMVGLATCLSVNPSLYGNGPANVFLVVNSSSPDSLAIANHYVHLRKIPATNVIYLDPVTILKKIDDESSHSKYFKSQIVDPVFQAIKNRGLEKQIDCIVYSSGFPTRFGIKPQLDKYLASKGVKYNIQRHAPWASLTSLTYFQNDLFAEKPYFIDVNANWYAQRSPSDLLSNPFVGDTANAFDTANDDFNAGRYSDSTITFSFLVEQNPEQVAVRYLLARSLASQGEDEQAIDQLAQCHRLGWAYKSIVEQDGSFSDLKNKPEFKRLMDRMADLPIDARMSRHFSSSKFWASNGWPNSSPASGRRYMLSTVLAVTGKSGSTLEQAIDQIESSVKADGSKPKGAFFFAKHKDVRSRVRQPLFSQAAAELESLGHQVVISSQKVPQKPIKIIGATLGSPVVDWNSGKGKFQPGALCDNFTSYGAWWSKAAQTQITDFLNAGAAGASGTVYEPYAIPPKFPDARLHVHYARGCTLAEAFYQSVNCPFQLLVVGDPLCSPFAEFPKFEIAGLVTRSVVAGDVEVTPTVVEGSPEISHYEVYLNGRFISRGEENTKIRIETDAMNDGYHELRIAAVSASRTHTKSSQVFEFFLRQSGNSVKVEIKDPTIVLGQPLVVSAKTTSGREVEIRQNSRVVGRIKGSESIELDSRMLGQGKSRIRAFTVFDQETVASVPVEFEVLAR